MTQSRRAIDLASARVLITNDDGIEAEGLKRLVDIVTPLAGEIWVCAPAEGHSGASAMVSLRREVSLEQRGPREFAIGGRPADCVLAALQLAMPDSPPDIVLSGINHGVNIGGDLIYSGTVGAAMTAAFNGIPAIALSADHPHGSRVSEETWAEVASYLPETLALVSGFGFDNGTVWGINCPIHATSRKPVLSHQGGTFDTMKFHAQGEGNYILHHEGTSAEGQSLSSGNTMSDFTAMTEGRIALTPLTIDRTDHALLREAAEAL